MTDAEPSIDHARIRHADDVQARQIIIRDIEEVAEVRLVEDLQIDVWGRSERDVVPLSQMIAARNVGGVLLGAFDGTTLAGFAYGFPGIHNDTIVLHSHMLAVVSAYRRRALGLRLKLAQRERALARGLNYMTWTFDPLQAMNANLNLAKLGALSDVYKVNVYGEQGSSFLHRHGTDRFFVSWLLDSPRVEARIERAAGETDAVDEDSIAEDFARAASLIEVGADDVPRIVDADTEAPHVRVEVPRDINAISVARPELARAWRAATRLTFKRLIADGYVAREFLRAKQGSHAGGTYLLSRGSLEDFTTGNGHSANREYGFDQEI